MSVQVIERNGQPEWAILPYEEYVRLVEQAEMLEDIQNYDRSKAAVENGDEEIIPANIVYALADGENPVKTWREYRQLSQQDLAKIAEISASYLSQIETGKRQGSTKVLAAIAGALNVDMDDLITRSEEQ